MTHLTADVCCVARSDGSISLFTTGGKRIVRLDPAAVLRMNELIEEERAYQQRLASDRRDRERAI